MNLAVGFDFAQTYHQASCKMTIECKLNPAATDAQTWKNNDPNKRDTMWCVGKVLQIK